MLEPDSRHIRTLTKRVNWENKTKRQIQFKLRTVTRSITEAVNNALCPGRDTSCHAIWSAGEVDNLTLSARLFPLSIISFKSISMQATFHFFTSNSPSTLFLTNFKRFQVLWGSKMAHKIFYLKILVGPPCGFKPCLFRLSSPPRSNQGTIYGLHKQYWSGMC